MDRYSSTKMLVTQSVLAEIAIPCLCALVSETFTSILIITDDRVMIQDVKLTDGEKMSKDIAIFNLNLDLSALSSKLIAPKLDLWRESIGGGVIEGHQAQGIISNFQ